MKKWNEWLNESKQDLDEILKQCINSVVDGDWTIKENVIDTLEDVAVRDNEALILKEHDVKFGIVGGKFKYINFSSEDVDFGIFPKSTANDLRIIMKNNYKRNFINIEKLKTIKFLNAELNLELNFDQTLEITKMISDATIDEYTVKLEYTEKNNIKYICTEFNTLLNTVSPYSLEFLIQCDEKQDQLINLFKKFTDCEFERKSLKIVAEDENEVKHIHDLFKVFSGDKSVSSIEKKKIVSKLDNDAINLLKSENSITAEYIHSIRGNIASNKFNL